MNDLALQLLTQELLSPKQANHKQSIQEHPSQDKNATPSSADEKNLWLLDENLNSIDVLRGTSACKIPLTLICNRFDLQQTLADNKVKATFSDFDLSSFQDNSINRIFYRISKEKTQTNGKTHPNSKFGGEHKSLNFDLFCQFLAL